MKTIRIGNGQGFWGDRQEAPVRLAKATPEMDYLTLDYLAEVSMSIFARQRERDAKAGYAADFLGVVEGLTRIWRGGGKVRVVTNAGGLNPQACARRCAEILDRGGCGKMKIGVVSGDDVMGQIRPPGFCHLETGESVERVF